MNVNQIAPNQITFTDEQGNKFFQSYDTVIVKRTNNGIVTLDPDYKCSTTTSKYRAIFLGETTKETEAKIKKGEYKIENLND